MQQRNKIPLAKPSTIRSILAGFLLVLFAFGITPRRTLHNIVANHKDGKPGSVAMDLHSEQLDKATFNCQCDNLVSESPFEPETHSLPLLHERLFAVYTDKIVTADHSSLFFCFSLRGPPAC